MIACLSGWAYCVTMTGEGRVTGAAEAAGGAGTAASVAATLGIGTAGIAGDVDGACGGAGVRAGGWYTALG